MHPPAVDNHFDWAMLVGLKIVAIDTETLHRPKGIKTILAGEVITKATRAVGESRDNGGPVRNALVTRHCELGRETSYRAYLQ